MGMGLIDRVVNGDGMNGEWGEERMIVLVYGNENESRFGGKQ